MTYRFIATLLAGASLFTMAHATSARAEDSITVASWGGAYQEAQAEAFFQPAAKALGITIKEDTTGGLADVRLQVTGNAVKWDIVELGADECARGTKEGPVREARLQRHQRRRHPRRTSCARTGSASPTTPSC